MHILYVQQLLVLPGSPGNRRCWDMARFWTEAGHQVSFLSSYAHFSADHSSMQAGRFPVAFEQDGIMVHALPVAYDHHWSFARRVRAFLQFFRLALPYGKKLPRPDLVLAYSAPLSVGELGRKLARHHQCPFVFEVADVWPDVPIGMGIIRQAWLIQYLYRRTASIYAAATQIVAFSKDMKAQICAHQVPEEKVQVIPNGVDLSQVRFRPRQSHSGPVRFLYSGTVGKANGLSQLLQAIEWIESQGRQDLWFTIIGKGNEWTQIRHEASKRNLSSLAMLPEVPREALQRYWDEADVGLICFAPFPVLEANGATKFFDYLAAGLPISINYEGWQSEYLSQYRCGLSAPQGDPITWARNLLILADQPDLRREMGGNGRQLAERYFDRAQLARQMEEVLIKVLAQSESLLP